MREKSLVEYISAFFVWQRRDTDTVRLSSSRMPEQPG